MASPLFDLSGRVAVITGISRGIGRALAHGFAEAGAIEQEDWNLSGSRYRPESREAVEHRDPRELLEELQEDVEAILGDIQALAAELRGEAA